MTVTKMLNKLNVTICPTLSKVQTCLKRVMSRSSDSGDTRKRIPASLKRPAISLLVLVLAAPCWADPRSDAKQEAEYYVAAYAQHYHVPVDFVRAVVEQESGWQRCAVSNKGAVGLMQLMPGTAARLNVRDRCSVNQNVSGGVRYLAWLMNRFHGDLRLVAAAYYAGEHAVDHRGLDYSNPNVVGYVASVRARFEREKSLRQVNSQRSNRRTR